MPSRFTRRAFLIGLGIGATILRREAKAHHRAGHVQGAKPSPPLVPLAGTAFQINAFQASAFQT